MTIEGDYVPSALDWVREQVELYERTGGREGNTLRDTGIPVIIVTMKGKASGKVRKIALMRVEHGGEYALVASKGGTPENPGWYHNLTSMPRVRIQDGATPRALLGHFGGKERAVCTAEADAGRRRAIGILRHSVQHGGPVFKATPRA